MRGIAQFQHARADDVGGGAVAESATVCGWRDDRELFDDEPIDVLRLDLLPRNVVEGIAVEVGDRQRDR